MKWKIYLDIKYIYILNLIVWGFQNRFWFDFTFKTELGHTFENFDSSIGPYLENPGFHSPVSWWPNLLVKVLNICLFKINGLAQYRVDRPRKKIWWSFHLVSLISIFFSGENWAKSQIYDSTFKFMILNYLWVYIIANIS